MASSELLNDASWSSIPTELLRAELLRRKEGDGDGPSEKPACGSGDKGTYDTSLHVFALFLILTLSTLACGFPLFSRQTSSQGSRRANTIIFLSQHFGTGVLIATAFVHLLPTAFVSLTDPCLPDFFTIGYNPTAGLVAMISALTVVFLESFLTVRGAGHSHAHNHGWDEDADSEDGADLKSSANGGFAAKRISGRRPADITLDDAGASRGLMTDVSPLPETTPTAAPRQQNGKHLLVPNKNGHHDSDDDEDDDDEDDDLDINLNELDPTTNDHTQPLTQQGHQSHPRRVSDGGIPQEPLTPEEQRRRMLQCMLLEAGILFHSIFIGMAVSVATGPPFVVFLIAIAFHQTFEGLALGSRIAAVQFPRSSIRPWLMVLAYGLTTPIGQAIGLGVHTLYDPKSQTGLLMVGFMNAVSSGLLLFAGLVQLLAEDFLTEKSYKTLKGERRRNAGLAVAAGATLMALVGAFA
ncbi:ZIP family zinc transporter [Astrocystis sublimbata]|nr:ZIP family zinc transporter [Astrocystis sublimbata]